MRVLLRVIVLAPEEWSSGSSPFLYALLPIPLSLKKSPMHQSTWSQGPDRISLLPTARCASGKRDALSASTACDNYHQPGFNVLEVVFQAESLYR